MLQSRRRASAQESATDKGDATRDASGVSRKIGGAAAGDGLAGGICGGCLAGPAGGAVASLAGIFLRLAAAVLLAWWLGGCATGPREVVVAGEGGRQHTLRTSGEELLHKSDLSVQVWTGEGSNATLPLAYAVQTGKDTYQVKETTIEIGGDTMLSVRVRPDGVEWWRLDRLFGFWGKLAPGLNSAISSGGESLETVAEGVSQ